MARLLRRWAALVAALAAAFGVAPAHAQLALSGEAGLVSDYRLRGLSASGNRPAVQAGLTLSHDSGLYAGIWGSTISPTPGGARAEIDLLLGYAKELSPGLGLDVGLAQYVYPSDPGIAVIEATGTLSYTHADFEFQTGFGYYPGQGDMRDRFGRREDNLYVHGGLAYSIPGTPLRLDAQIGLENGNFDSREKGAKIDYRLGATVDAGAIALGLQYFGSNVRLLDERQRQIGGQAVVATALFGF